MRRCIRSILLSVTLFAVLTSTANACFFFPLFDPLNWCIGHQNPYATYRVIDDWLGYGYLRGQQNGSLGHYPGRPWNCYTPMYPRLTSPFQMPQSYVNPLMIPQTRPMYSAPVPTTPYMTQPYMVPQWNTSPLAGDCGCGESAPATPQYQIPVQVPQYQPTPWGNSGDCNCGPAVVQQLTVPVQVPVTTYRPVTVDRGSYQMVWIPRPVTQMVPQTSWQTRYIQQPAMATPAPAFQMMPSLPMSSPCGDTPCNSGDSFSPSDGVPYPEATTFNSGTSGQYYAATSPLQTQTGLGVMPAPAYPAVYPAAPYRGLFPQYGTPQQYNMRPNYSPMTYGYNQQTANLYPSPVATMNGLQPAVVPGVGYGDIWGDHEQATIAGPSNTAMIPVVPNAYRGAVPVVRTTFTAPLRSASSRKYPNSVW